MNFVAQLFARKKQARFEESRPIREQYREIVRALANGDELDESEVFAVCDQLEITEQKLSSDIATQQKRFELADQRTICLAAAKDIERLLAEKQKQDAEYQAFMANWQPRAQATAQALRDAELRKLQFADAEQRLLNSVYDQELLDRDADLAKRKHEVGMKLRDLEEPIRTNERLIGYRRAALEDARLREHSRPTRFIDSSESNARERFQDNVSKAEAELQDAINELKLLTAERDKLKAEMRSLDQEQAELDSLKLIP